MPKVKTHSGAKKRFTKLKSGKVKYSKGFKRHLLTKKSAGRKRDLRKTGHIAACDLKNILKLLPY